MVHFELEISSLFANFEPGDFGKFKILKEPEFLLNFRKIL